MMVYMQVEYAPHLQKVRLSHQVQPNQHLGDTLQSMRVNQ